MKKIILITILFLLVGIVSISGCTFSDSTNASDSRFPDLKLANTPSVMHHSDNSGNIFGGIQNTGSSAYTKVKVEVIGYDSEDNVVYNQTETIARIEPGSVGDISIVLTSSESNIDYVDMVVVDATET